MSPVARVENFEIIMLGHPRVTPGSAFTCKNPNGAPGAINLGGDLLILGFWPKTISYHMVMHKKATITLWFAKKTQVESVFFLIFGQFGSFRDVLGVVLGSFWGQSDQFAWFKSF